MCLLAAAKRWFGTRVDVGTLITETETIALAVEEERTKTPSSDQPV
jgi:hypothetical protein